MNQEAVQKSERRREMMLDGNLLKVIPVIALPQVVAMLIDSIYNMTNTYFVSQLGDAAIAAVGINDSLMNLIRAIAMAFGMGTASYISRLLGAGEHEKASRVASTNLFTALGTMVVIAVGCFCFLSPLMTLMGSTESSKFYSMEYARWIILSSPITAGTVCLSQTLRGEGSTTFSMVGSVSGCIVNAVIDPIFITTLGFGVAGAGMATAISKVISFIILLAPFLRRKCILRLSLKLFSPSVQIYAEIAKMGVPTGLRAGLMTISTIVLNNIAGGFGDVALAAVSIANKSMRMVASAIMGFGQGFQPIAGFCWGAKRYERVKKAFYNTSTVGLVLGVLLGVILGIFAPQVVRVFSANEDMINIGTRLIRAQCMALPIHVWAMIATGLFQGLGKSIPAAILGLSRNLFSLIPCLIILPWLFGLSGLIYAQAVADFVSFFMALGFTIPAIRELKSLQAQQNIELCAVTEDSV